MVAIKHDQGKLQMSLLPVEVMYGEEFNSIWYVMQKVKQHKYTAAFDMLQQNLGTKIDYLRNITAVLEFGAIKYERDNWLKGMEWSRLEDAAIRHLSYTLDGVELDDESGLPHVHHAACCIMFLIVYKNRGINEPTD